MPSTWNRNVDFDAAGDVLVVSITGKSPPPPAPPPGQTRNDTARRIDVYKLDRGAAAPGSNTTPRMEKTQKARNSK